MRVRVADYVVVSLAVSIILSPGFAMAQIPVNSVNTINDGRIITGGNYYNTPTGVTSFINSGSGGLWLKSGSTIRGQQVDGLGNLSPNGGAVHLYAPNQVVRIDGNINVNGAMSVQGAPLGDGGSVTIDSGYLFQNGNIYANGANGGMVQVNVGGMALGQGAQIQVGSVGNGHGGIVAINSSGPVDLRKNTLIQTTGNGYQGSNTISIEGSLVNVDGVIKADGTTLGSNGGTIRLVASGQSDYQGLKNILQNATQNSSGDSSTPTLSADDRTFILQRIHDQVLNHDGDVMITRDTVNTNPAYIARLSANATTPDFAYYPNSSGGTIIVTAMHDVINQGHIIANGALGGPVTLDELNQGLDGGRGGTISVTAMDKIINDKGLIQDNGGAGTTHVGEVEYHNPAGFIETIVGDVGGSGGPGGLIAFGYHNGMSNSGGIYADGGANGFSGIQNGVSGNGGLVVFSGNTNPTSNGSIDVLGRLGNAGATLGGKPGTIVSPNPTTLGQSQVYFQQGYVNGEFVSNRATAQTQTNELLVDLNGNTLISLTKNGGNANTNLFSRMVGVTPAVR